MGNCHAVDPVCATVEHPNGKVEKLYFSSSAQQLMLQHPGHYVALVPPPHIPSAANGSAVHVKRKLKLLPPDTMLNIGSCYRLVSFEDVLSDLSDKGNMAHQTSRKRTQSSSKQQHSSTPPVPISKEHLDVSKSAVKHINQLRAMLTKSFAKESEIHGLSPPAALATTNYSLATTNYSSILSPLQSLHPVYRGGTWRPSLQSISERGR